MFNSPYVLLFLLYIPVLFLIFHHLIILGKYTFVYKKMSLAEGEIVKLSKDFIENRPDVAARYRLEYRYIYQGQLYSNWVVTPYDMLKLFPRTKIARISEEEFVKFKRKYEEAQCLSVWVNPNQPDYSVLLKKSPVPGIILWSLTMILGAGWLVYIWSEIMHHLNQISG